MKRKEGKKEKEEEKENFETEAGHVRSSRLVWLLFLALNERRDCLVAHGCAEVSPYNKESDRIQLPIGDRHGLK